MSRKYLRDAVDLEHGAKDLQVDEAGCGTFGGVAGGVAYGGNPIRAQRILLPTENTAYARTVRIHELVHAQKHGRKRGDPKWLDTPEAQFVMDVLVHTIDWPKTLPAQANRDALCAAMQDARKCLKKPSAPTDERELNQWRGAVCGLLRSLAITRTCCGARTRGSMGEYTRLLGRIRKWAGSEVLSDALENIISTATDGVAGKAKAQKRKARLEQVKKATAALMALLGATVIPGEGPLEVKGGNKPGEGDGKGKFPPMQIVKLPMPCSCDALSVSSRSAPSGARLNIHRAPQAVITGKPSGLFRRTRREVGGTVLIDASGSMGAKPETIKPVCLAATTATVAYYSGHSREGSHLVVFAEHGRRASPRESLLRQHNGNNCDLEALKWLLKQQAPRIMVTDRDFCGGPEGSAAAAKVLLEMAERTGAVTVVTSLGGAVEHFKKLRQGL